MKKRIVIAIVFVISVLCVNALSGNPVSKHLAERSVKEYLSSNFADLDVYTESITYDAKTGNYEIYVKSESSIDTYFKISTNKTGDVLFDTYKTDVLSGFNTYRRLNSEYGTRVDSVWNQATCTYTLRWCLGNLEIISPENDLSNARDHITMDTLELDKAYEVHELGKSIGYISIAIVDDSVTFERMAELMLDVKARFDDADVSFHAVSMTIQSSAEQGEAAEYISITDFLYSDIYVEELVQRLQAFV